MTGEDKFEAIQRKVKVLILAKAWKYEVRKLEISVVPGTLAETIFYKVSIPCVVNHMKCVRKVGAPPLGDLERQIQEMGNGLKDLHMG